MRAYALLLVFAMPPLLACGAARAKVATDMGKPVCVHYDDSSTAAPRSAAATSAPSHPTTSAGLASSAQPAATTTAPAQPRSGSTPDALRSHYAPHWQTFLPGMFR